MKLKRFLPIQSFMIAVSLFAASLAGATALTLSGTNNASAYQALYDPEVGLVTPIPVTVPAGPWVSGSWITYNNPDQSWPMDSTSGNLPGTYYYLTSFDLTGLDPATALIKGSWASDNGSSLYLNDVVPTNIVSTTSGYSSLTNFTITSGFRPGMNFLTFAVINDPWGDEPYINPTGLLVNIDRATADPVPEPSTILLLGGGLIGVCLARRRARG